MTVTAPTLTRDDGLAGKVALITGGASGIGRALAVAYARAGTKSVIGYYPGDPHDVGETIAAVEQAGGTATAIAVDVRKPEEVDALAQAVVDLHGRLDIVVASAAIIRQSPLEDLTDHAWDEMLNVDLTGVMRTFRAASRVMTGPGAMIGLSSFLGAAVGWRNNAHYCAAKAGVVGMGKALAVELAPRQIRVNTVIPGLIETPQTLDEVNSVGADGLAALTSLIPWGRVGKADEVARVIRFLTSDDATFISGQTVTVDGGMTVNWPAP